MLLVNTYIGPSENGGVGLFADQFIEKGTAIWTFHSNTTQVFWKKQFVSVCSDLSLPAILELLDYSYIKKGHVYCFNDKSKFINHSNCPNIAFDTAQVKVAMANIERGDEI